MPTLAVYPGSFDPLTNGHVDIITRGARLFDRIIVAVAINAEKTPLFTMDERVESPAMTRGVEVANEVGRARAEDGQERFDRLDDARHTAEGESGGAERHHFTVGRIGEPPDQVHRVGRRLRVVERAIQLVEPLAERRWATQRDHAWWRGLPGCPSARVWAAKPAAQLRRSRGHEGLSIPTPR